MDIALRAFARAMAAADAEIDLARAALLIARVEYPSLAIERYLAALDQLADASGARGIGDPVVRLHRLREYLFEEARFRGNAEDYYDPRNSCLNDVLDRRVGIPITLSLVLVEVGRRVGLALAGVGLPGHFIVRARVGGEGILLDPFNGGTTLTPEACEDVVARALGHPVSLRAEHFGPVTKRQFLVRMLNNLKLAYWQREDWPRVVAVFDRLLVADEHSLGDVRDRGTVLNKLGQYQRGLADWERYLTACPEASDAPPLRQRLRRARMMLASLN